MKQRLGSDVEVEQSSGAAQFGQTQEGPDESGLVGQKQSHRVPFFELPFRLQRSGHFVALFIHFLVSVLASFEVHKHFRGMLLHCIQETVQQTVEGLDLLVLGEPDG